MSSVKSIEEIRTKMREEASYYVPRDSDDLPTQDAWEENGFRCNMDNHGGVVQIECYKYPYPRGYNIRGTILINHRQRQVQMSFVRHSPNGNPVAFNPAQIAYFNCGGYIQAGNSFSKVM
jgi:hypothetical protein